MDFRTFMSSTTSARLPMVPTNELRRGISGGPAAVASPPRPLLREESGRKREREGGVAQRVGFAEGEGGGEQITNVGVLSMDVESRGVGGGRACVYERAC